jgi:hypothetical protein
MMKETDDEIELPVAATIRSRYSSSELSANKLRSHNLASVVLLIVLLLVSLVNG